MEKASLRNWLRQLAPDQFDHASLTDSSKTRPIPPGAASERERQASNEESLETHPTDCLSHGETMLLSVSRPAMACEFEVLLNQHQYSAGAEKAVRALEFIEEMELLLSVYKPRSELSNVNRFGSQRPQPLSFDTLQLLQLAKAAHRWTGGAFDITAGSLSEVWGFSRREGRRPTEEQIEKALQNVGSDKLRLDPESAQASVDGQGVQVNPGGIGKGYALDRAAGRLAQDGVHHFMLHGGLSSIVARGDRLNEVGWQVSLKHPWRWEEHLGTIRLKNQALGTSGSGKQFFHFGGKRYSHIIDPRTGWPAQGMMSTTVICPSAAVADCLATALFVMGVVEARRFCETHPEIGAVLVFQDEKSGRQRIESFNLGSDTWQPR